MIPLKVGGKNSRVFSTTIWIEKLTHKNKNKMKEGVNTAGKVQAKNVIKAIIQHRSEEIDKYDHDHAYHPVN